MISSIMKQKILKYDVIFEEQEVGGYTVIVPSLPGCISEGDTLDEAKENIEEAITAYLESMIKNGEKLPQKDTNIFIGQISINNPVLL
jgi:antitoxin HicB